MQNAPIPVTELARSILRDGIWSEAAEKTKKNIEKTKKNLDICP